MHIKHTKCNGFTLIEVIIYTTILSITGTILSGVLLNTTRIKSRQTAVIEVNEQLNFVLQNIQRSIMDSSLIDISNSVSTSTLVLRFKEENKNPTKFYISDNKVYKKEAGGAPQQLTDDSVIATAVNFLKVSGYSGHDSLQIDLTLSYNTNNPAAAFSRTLSSAIARVSAATFDSSLIPGSDNLYDVGLDTTKWKNLYVSGKTSFGGVEYTWPATDGTTGQNLSTNGVGVLSWATPPGYWTASGNNIYNTNSGNIGIGTTNPSTNLHVAGSAGVSTTITTTSSTEIPSLWLANNFAGTVHWGGMGLVGDNSLRFSTTGSFSNAGITLLSDGNVGIGTVTPNPESHYSAPTLTVLGSASNISAIEVGAQIADADAQAYGDFDVIHGNTTSTEKRLIIIRGSTDGTTANARGGKLSFSIKNNNAASFTEAMTIRTGGNVGIGTTNPGSKLDVGGIITGVGLTLNGANTAVINQIAASTYASYQNIQNTTGLTQLGTESNTGGYIMTGSAAYSSVFGSNGAYPVHFGTNGTARMTILPTSGNVGIGTTNPQSNLQVGIPADGIGQFLQIDTGGGIPISTDCDADAERGRTFYDSADHRLYVCGGAVRGWDYLSLTD